MYVLVKKSRAYYGGPVTALPDSSRTAITLSEARRKADIHKNPVGFDIYEYCPESDNVRVKIE